MELKTRYNFGSFELIGGDQLFTDIRRLRTHAAVTRQVRSLV
jgi:hypothetical protein